MSQLIVLSYEGQLRDLFFAKGALTPSALPSKNPHFLLSL
ncbi:hypothetical protein SAIL_7970 [Streptococcus agalactiae ILRI112]|nr:hypothetical protein SAIL_7970 [Streptococcus agalactiae ILRI112]